VYEPITVQIDRGHGEGNYRSYTINFVGRLVRIVEDGHITMRLYEWAGRGRLLYLVHIEEDKPGRPPRRTLYPFINTHVRFRYSLENSPKSKVYVWDSVPKPVPKSTSRYSPMLAGFETRFPRAPAFFPPASNLQGRRGGSIDFYVCAHEYSSPLEYAAS
jgi:hypothetical protein